MKCVATELEGVMIVEPRVFEDVRGYFFESWNVRKLREAGVDATFVQDNESKSKRGVLRGLHYQLPPHSQAKLVRVVRGAALDVVVDIRKGSPTYGKHVSVELSGENKRQLFIPRGFAHGFAALRDDTILCYKCDREYQPSHERGVNFADPALGIDWRLDAADRVVLPKDLSYPPLADAEVYDYALRDSY